MGRSPARAPRIVDLRSACGNGVVDAPEACDDGNRIHGDGCSTDCLSEEYCGNGCITLARVVARYDALFRERVEQRAG
jgi:cysteine-rich repeat protein